MVEVPVSKETYDKIMGQINEIQMNEQGRKIDAEIDKERGVVLEESRLGKGANDRMNKVIYPKVFAGSKYADRLPIGKEDILKNFKYDLIKRFYKDWYRPDLMAVVAVGEEYLRIVSWSFMASGVIFVASSMFQAMGNTIPSLVSSFTRIVGTAIPVLFLSRMPGFSLRWVWLLSAVTVFAQMALSLLLLRREFRRRLTFAADATASPAPL